jgi:hypothetical protein
MAEKKYRVTLTEAEREQLTAIINRGNHSAQKRKQAQALLLAAKGYTDEVIAEWVGMHRRGIEGIRQRFVEEGFEATLEGKERGYRQRSIQKKFLKSGVMVDGLVSQNEQGTPQSGNLSPLLSNVYLTRFDQMLEERGHTFVRYTDDCNIYVKSGRAAERVMEGCTKYLEGKLKVNRKKSAVGSPLKLKFLGFSLYRRKEGIGIRVHEKPLERLMDKLRSLTRWKRDGKMERILQKFSRLLIGWLGYYRIADLKVHLKRISGWLRRRRRQIYWKRARTRCENLIQLGIPPDQAGLPAHCR